MAVDQFCLKWNNFQSSIINAFESLQATQDLADVTLTCEGINIKAHKIILSACSPYFRTVFKENPCPHPIVILKDVLYVDLLAVLNFMYHGEVLVSKDNLKSFLQTAELLQVSGLNGYSDFNVKNVPKNIPKIQKPSRPPEATEHVQKKIKTTTKSKSLKKGLDNISDTCLKENMEDLIEAVELPKVKMEVSDNEDEYSSDFNKNMHDEKFKQGSILEAALDGKDQSSSILERSLTLQANSVRSPSVPVPLEHVAVIHTIPELPKAVFLAKKSPDETNLDFANTDAFKAEGDAAKLGDMSHLVQNEICNNPHHSSQCGNCPHCGKIYSNQSALKYHVRLMHSDLTNMYCCHLCPESFDYREGYKKHMVEIHNIRN